MSQRVVCIARELLGTGRPPHPDELIAAARARVASGDLVESLVCLALSGDAQWLRGADSGPARARIDLLLWEAGAAATTVAELGVWLGSDPVAREDLLYRPARGTLRERSLAARLLAIAGDGMSIGGLATSAAVEVTGVAQQLAGHPEPSVWVPAVRALGRLAGRVPSLRFQLVRWLDSPAPSRRRRAVTALASVPADGGDWVEPHLLTIPASPDRWQRAALGPAAPYLARERSGLWRVLAGQLFAEPGPEVAWSVTAGLLALSRGQPLDPADEALLHRTRQLATATRPSSFAEAQLWQVIRRDTDFLDQIDPDPGFPDLLLDRAVRDAVRLGAGAVAQRAAALARSIGGTFDAMLRGGGTADSRDERGHALAAVESCARAAALGLWQPILRAAGRDPGATDAEVGDFREHMGSVFAAYLEVDELDFALRRTALRALANLVDATGPDDAPSRVAATVAKAVAGSRWARGSRRDELRRFRKPVADLLWRVNDVLPGADRGGPRLGPLAAWWVLGVSDLELLELGSSPEDEVDERVARAVAALRGAAGAALAGASVASWSGGVAGALDDLGAGGTRLAQAVRLLCAGLEAVEGALTFGPAGDSRPLFEFLATPTALVGELCREPAAALTPATREVAPPAVASELVALSGRALTGDLPVGEVAQRWSASLGPLLGPIVKAAVLRLLEAARREVDRAARAVRVGPYRKLRRLGGGGQSEVWLVRGSGARRFVLKLPHAPRALAQAQRAELGRVLAREAELLESLHEAKVATYCDHGWDGDTPYLVLQYLIGTNLAQYAAAGLLEVGELKPIVRDICLGLRALHERGIVHRDLKPSNVFLRLQLPRDAAEQFGTAHRNPAVAPVAEAVLIDFGIARLIGEAGGERAEGTLGFLAPEQADVRDQLTGAADVYGLAATIFAVTTGVRLFADRPDKTAHLLAHAFERPFADPAVLVAAAQLPSELRELLADATALEPDHRPRVDEFARRFAEL